MPRLSPARMMEIVRRHVEDGVPIDELWAGLEPFERRDLLALADYHRHYVDETTRRRGKPQRRARALFRSLLTPEQRRQMDVDHRGVDVVGSAGGLYRLFPNTGGVQLRRPWGSRTRFVGTFCYHPEGELPPADRSVGHLLILTNDEPRFLAEANFTDAKGRRSRNGVPAEPLPAARFVCRDVDLAPWMAIDPAAAIVFAEEVA